MAACVRSIEVSRDSLSSALRASVVRRKSAVCVYIYEAPLIAQELDIDIGTQKHPEKKVCYFF